MTNELPASPSEIYANDTKVFQLKALSLNFLRNTSEISDEHIPKLNPCHFCNKEILALPLHSFTVLSWLLYELSTPIKRKTTETNKGSGGSISQNLARLFQKAIKAEKCVTQAYQKEIYCWYYYAERFEKSVKNVKR
ncbi:996_t:CDS:2 [Funneliformis geosporum]|nr:996_t:CDS:2 [Funneliformis geosporum]